MGGTLPADMFQRNPGLARLTVSLPQHPQRAVRSRLCVGTSAHGPSLLGLLIQLLPKLASPPCVCS